MKKLAILLMALLNLYVISFAQNERAQDSLSLVAFYNATNGSNWTNHSGWLESNVPISQWHGITVENGRVARLELWNNNLSGNLPVNTGEFPGLGDLTGLRDLYLGGNQLTGSIPDEIGNLTNLQSIQLNGNQLSGSIPGTIGNLINLYNLGLSENQLTGSISIQLGQLTNLQYLYLQNNQVSGELPIELGLMTNLRNILLANNNLSGIIPDALCDITTLEQVNFQDNNFDDQSCPTIKCLKDKGISFLWDYNQRQKNGFSLTSGCIYNPVSAQDSLALEAIYNGTNGASWNNKTNWLVPGKTVATWHGVTVENGRVTRLELWNNNLAGSLPVTIGDLTGLRDLYLGGNQITGQIPTQIGNLANLQNLYLYGNQFAGDIPAAIGNLTTLYNLNLDNNQLTGIIPTQIGQLQNLQWLYLNNNQLTGNIPTEIGSLPNLRNIAVANNNLSGVIPESVCNIPNLQSVVFVNNNFDDQSCSTIRCLKNKGVTFDWNPQQTQQNGFSLTAGCIYNPVLEADSTALVAFYNATNGASWTNKLNWLTLKPVSSWYGVTVENNRVTRLELWNNNLFGTLPAQIGDLPGLRELYLGGNQLAGSIPDEFGNLTNLQSVQLNDSHLTGAIPGTIGNLTNLYNLGLGENQLTGSIPAQIGQLTNLQYLYLQNNQLSGELPLELGLITNLRNITLANNNFSGIIPDGLCDITTLEQVNFQYNNFDDQSCPTIKCLKEQGVNFVWDYRQVQKNGFSLTAGCFYNPVSESDSTALVAIYNATNGASWTNKTNWLVPGKAVATWQGVTVENGRVIRVELWSNNLTGTLPADLGNLTGLVDLYIGGNQIEGQIPTEIGLLTNLSNLSLNANKFSGTIPIQIGQLQNLWSLYLNNNQLNGEVPTSLEGLINLRNLGLADNSFSGIIPNGLCDITTLQEVNFQDNNFNDQSCPTIKCLKEKGVNFVWDSRQPQKNGFSLTNGCIYNPVSEQDSLALVAIYNATNGSNWTNKLNWLTLKPVSSWYGVTVENNRVTGLSLQNNNLSGSLPIHIGNLTGLRNLYLSANIITGQIPSEIGNISNLQYLNLYINKFSGEIPVTLGNLNNLLILNLGDNQLSGSIDAIVGGLYNLHELVLVNNSLAGKLPEALCNLFQLGIVNFAGNNFDDQSCTTIQCLKNKGVNFTWDYNQRQKNGFSLTNGCIYNPVSETDSLALVAFYNSTNGASWTNKTNWLVTGKAVATWQGVTVENGRVTRLEFWNNNLSGSLPVAIGDLTGLRDLSLGGNQITGQIPAEIGSLTNLTTLYFHSNKLSGSIPVSLGNLTNLYTLNLENNQLTGIIPVQIGLMANLQNMYLTSNKLTGEIPSTLSGLSNLRYLALAHNSLSGIIPAGICNIQNLQNVNFIGNQFNRLSCPTIQCLKDKGVNFEWNYTQQQQNGYSLTNGCIYNPVSAQDSLALVAFYNSTNGANWNNNNNWLTIEPVATWFGVTIENGRVTGLDLSLNNLLGSLPAELGNLTGLRSLMLYQNQINGSIPAELGNLTNLGIMNLFGNQLTGTIPSEFGNLSNLTNIRLSENFLSGVIPESICNIPNLQYVNFMYNNFDVQSCPTIQCLKNKGVNLVYDATQPQRNGLSLTGDCNPNIIRTLIITEARMDRPDHAYVELTNVGTIPVQLADFEFGRVSPWDTYSTSVAFIRLPNRILQPGESFLIASVCDFNNEQFPLQPDFFNERLTKEEMWNLADMLIHMPEPNGDNTDEITPGYSVMETWWGRDCWYLKHHILETESAVVDQVGGVFDNDGRNYDKAYDVAGVFEATKNTVLVRKSSVNSGNLNFASARGTNSNDSEWLPIPLLSADWEPWRAVFWTAGNHGDFNLDENTFVSSTLTVDLQNKTITAPWGIRNNDDFISEFEQKPGLAWHYHLSEAGDDLDYISARTGDRITIYACGNDLDMETFNIVVNAPTASDNIVIPKHRPVGSNFFPGFGANPGEGQIDWPRVTQNDSGIDFITGSHFGIPYATRVDTLLKYLEKAPYANWEIVFAGGVQRADLIDGDILKVIAENGAVKEYYIQVQAYRPAHYADLASIIWPNIPEELRGTDGWKGDTIPNFISQLYEYTINIPHHVTGVPVFVPIPTDRKATITTKIIDPLEGNIANKTIEYTITAEDGYLKQTYLIHLNKLKDPASIQPFLAEPFLSEYIFWEQWSNTFAEIANPGNQPLDLSNYMIASEDYMYDPASMIQASSKINDWGDRFCKYVPGYKWVNEAQWQVTPGMLEPDPKVNPIVQPGDVFCLGDIYSDSQTKPSWMPDYLWPVPAQLDVQFHNLNETIKNPWGETVNSWLGSPIRKWSNGQVYLFKILNDSIKLGLKPANDPGDFQLIDIWGMGQSTDWIIGGKRAEMVTNWMRKPEIYKGNPVPKASFGTTPENSEWTWTNQKYWQSKNAGWPLEILNIANDLGKHNLIEVTDHQSVVYSEIYRVSSGYSMNETIHAIITGTTASQFNDNIIKANENQTLILTSGVDGAALNITDVLSNGDILTVVSADGSNTTRYFIVTSEIGLSNEVVIVPEENSTVVVQDNAFTGFVYGTTLQDLMANIVVPEGATVTIVDVNNNPVPFTIPNYQGEYVDVSVNAGISIIVTAEDGVTEMVYNLEPEFVEGEIFVASDFFEINQEDLVVGTVEPGTTVEQLLANLYTIPGATIKIVDKYGFERTTGPLYPDDKLVVTYDENAYYGLKALAEPLVKEYLIFICGTPVAEMLKDIVIELDINSSASVTLGQISDPTVGGCGTFTLSMLNSDYNQIESVSYNCENLGHNYVIVALNNIFGRVSTAHAKVTVVDKIAPVAKCKPVTVQLDATGKGSVNAAAFDNGSTDNCGIKTMIISKKDFNCNNIGANTVVFTVQDFGGNISTCQTTVNVEYNATQVAVCKPATIQLDATGSASVSAKAVFDGVSNTCNIKSLNLSQTEFSCSELGVNTVTLTVEDINGNSSTCLAEVKVEDKIAPQITANDVTDDVNNLISYITTSDNCVVASTTNDAPPVFTQEITDVTWTVKDASGNSNTAIQKVTVTNRPPVILSIDAPFAPVDIVNSISLIAHYNDNNLVTAVWNWGDGTTSDSNIGENILGTHNYLQPGVYMVSLTITDDYNLSASIEHRYIVIYNPEGGFVTGGGWINSPLGASVLFPDATGKAEFGFVSKYQKGTSIPTGNTEFKFKAGNLNFKSSEYEWLVIAGSKAKFKGKGTINGTGNYGFMISAIDGDLKTKGAPDLFRIKIWDINTGVVVYDNQMGASEIADPVTAIAGGSIVIHDPKIKSGVITSVDELNGLNPEQFKVYPNPASEIIKVSGFTPANYIVKVIDMSGREILVKLNKSPEMEINISHLPTGIYNLAIQLNNKSVVYQIIKK